MNGSHNLHLSFTHPPDPPFKIKFELLLIKFIILDRFKMPRNYKRRPGSAPYKDYPVENMEKAVAAVKSGAMTAFKASKKFNVPRITLYNKVKGVHSKSVGGQTVLSGIEELVLRDHLLFLAEFGFPMTQFELRIIVKSYLDSTGKIEKRFKNNFPGVDWVVLFLKRHKNLTQRFAANIKPQRARVSKEVIRSYFDQLSISLTDVPPDNIWNYDETNLADDPGSQKIIAKRGCKYPERVIHSSKSAHSVMFCGNAVGEIMPPYVVYKAENLWTSWVNGGPKGTRFNRTTSGWFDQRTFEDWFEYQALPILKKQDGKKLLIGDNLSSHLSIKVVQLCEENNIRFVALPPNSTHMTQPLDVAFFRPFKIKWRQILNKWKLSHGNKALKKDTFPTLLKEAVDEVMQNKQSLVSGFRKCGIYPLNREAVLERMPLEEEEIESPIVPISENVSNTVLTFLTEQRYGPADAVPSKRQKISVEPGKSISTEDLAVASTSAPKAGSSKKKQKKRKTNVEEQLEEEAVDDVAQIPDFPPDSEEFSPDNFPETNTFSIGEYVIVDYEGEKFPGKIVNLDTDEFEVSVMCMKGQDWAWPEKLDQMWYFKKDVLERIKEPELIESASRRKRFRVPEIDKYRSTFSV